MNWGTLEAAPPASAASETPESEWAITDWQKYDWRSVAALGEAAGVVVSQLILSPRFAAELADALDDAVEQYRQRFGPPA